MEKSKVTSAKEWREKTQKGIEILLPSQVIVRLKKLTFSAMIKKGEVPTNLVGKAINYTEGNYRRAVSEPKIYLENIEVIEWICSVCVIEPTISLKETTKDDEIYIDDLSDMDKLTISQVAMGHIAPTDPEGKKDEKSESGEQYKKFRS